MLKLLELFGGIGACSRALDHLGIEYEIADYVEIDKYAVQSYNAIHGTHFEPQDVQAWDKQLDVDLIMHGSPCQDFSIAGKNMGGNEGSGTRSSLMYETIRIVSNLKPKYVLWENVKNILSEKHIYNFHMYLDKMDELGYRNYYKVLNAKDYGIPQNRERVFTVSIRKDIKEEFVMPEPFPLEKRLKDLLEDEVDEKYYLSNKGIEYVLAPKRGMATDINANVCQPMTAKGQNNWTGSFISPDIDHIEKSTTIGSKEPTKIYLNEELAKSMLIDQSMRGLDMGVKGYNEIAPAITSRDFKEPRLINETARVNQIAIKEATKKGYHEAKEGDYVNLQFPNSTTRRGRVGEQQANTLLTSDEQGVVVAIDEQNKCVRYDGTVGTITTDGSSPKHNNRVSNGLRIRKLTPRECWRLMGFDDEAFDQAEKVCSNSQLYKQAGNSIVVDVLEKILTNLLINPQKLEKEQMSIFDFIERDKL